MAVRPTPADEVAGLLFAFALRKHIEEFDRR
jgi:hypothetical protein